jgi:hypothetical protein
MIALALALALAAPAGAKNKKVPKEPVPAAASAPAPDPVSVASGAAADGPLDPDILGFLSLSRSTASRDGGVKLPWDGPGGPQLKLSWDALDRRNEQLSMGDMMARSIVQAVQQFYDTEGGVDPTAMKAKLKALVGAPMEDARTSYLDAVNWEERRLFFIEKAIAQAAAENTGIPGIDADLVSRRAAAIRSGRVKQEVGVQMDGYRDLTLGLVAYLEGDNFGALERVRNAAKALPDFAVAHAFLGSIYFLFDQKEAAVHSWRRAYQLDPTNKGVAEALKEHDRPKKQKSVKN